MKRWLVVVEFPEPLIGTVRVEGIEAQTRAEAIQQARIRKQWPPGCSFCPREQP